MSGGQKVSLGLPRGQVAVVEEQVDQAVHLRVQAATCAAWASAASAQGAQVINVGSPVPDPMAALGKRP